jgi:hypothetical protein
VGAGEVFGERSQAGVDGHAGVGAPEQGQHRTPDPWHHGGGVEVEDSAQEAQVRGRVVSGQHGRVPGALRVPRLLGKHGLNRAAPADQVCPRIHLGHRFGNHRLIVAFSAHLGFEALALLPGRGRAGAGVADDAPFGKPRTRA